MSQSFVSQPFQLLLHLLQRSINTLCEGAWHLSQDRHRAGSWGWKAHESRLTWEVSWVALCIYLNSVSLFSSNPTLWCHQDVTNCYNKKRMAKPCSPHEYPIRTNTRILYIYSRTIPGHPACSSRVFQRRAWKLDDPKLATQRCSLQSLPGIQGKWCGLADVNCKCKCGVVCDSTTHLLGRDREHQNGFGLVYTKLLSSHKKNVYRQLCTFFSANVAWLVILSRLVSSCVVCSDWE
jgi:hypothetical protein